MPSYTYNPNFWGSTFGQSRGPGFKPEDWFTANEGEDFRDVQRNVGAMAAQGQGWGSVNSRVASRIGRSMYDARNQHVLNQVAAGSQKPINTMEDTMAHLGGQWASGQMQPSQDPYDILMQIQANARAAAASGTQEGRDYLDMLENPTIMSAVLNAVNRKYGSIVAGGMQRQLNDFAYQLERMAPDENVGDYISKFWGFNPGVSYSANTTFGSTGGAGAGTGGDHSGGTTTPPVPPGLDPNIGNQTPVAPDPGKGVFVPGGDQNPIVPPPTTIGGAPSPVTDPLGEVETVPRPRPGMPAPLPGLDPGNNGQYAGGATFNPGNPFTPGGPGTPGWMGDTSPTDMQADTSIRQVFVQNIGREPTPNELTWWANRYRNLGRTPDAISNIVNQISQSQPAQRYRLTGQAAPAVTDRASAEMFYDWLFGGTSGPPEGRDQWLNTYLRILGLG